jgi:PleD family two-component response regulator
VTISIGLAELKPAMRIDEALAHADAALYEAKHGGRNQVRLYHAAGTPPATQAGQPAP